MKSIRDIRVEKLIDKHSEYFPTICDWQYDYWGKMYGDSYEQTRAFMEHSICNDRIPQTYIAILGDEVVGMYQISMYDLDVRPDIYPWLVNVYVDEKHRGKGICTILMKNAIESFKKLGLKEVYLYTKHIGLYEKYGWQFVEEIETFEKYGPVVKLYKFSV